MNGVCMCYVMYGVWGNVVCMCKCVWCGNVFGVGYVRGVWGVHIACVWCLYGVYVVWGPGGWSVCICVWCGVCMCVGVCEQELT